MIILYSVRPEQARFLQGLADEVEAAKCKFAIAADAMLLGGPPAGTVTGIDVTNSTVTIEVPDADAD